MSNQMAAVRNMMEHIPRPWHGARHTPQLAPQRVREAYVSPNPSVTDILYSAQHHIPLAGQEERSLRGIVSAGMLALHGLFKKGGQKLWRGMNRGLQPNASPNTRVYVEVGRLTLSPQTQTSAELIEPEGVVTGEILDGAQPLSGLVDPSLARSPVSPAFEETIVATWARVAQESRALGMPMDGDVVGYLKTQSHLWGGDEAEATSVLEKYIDQLDPEKHADYGTMPKDVGYAWVHSTLLYREGDDSDATQHFVKEEMKKWGWNDAAAAVVLGEIAREKLTQQAPKESSEIVPQSEPQEPRGTTAPAAAWKHVPNQPRMQSPEQVAAASIHGGGNSGGTPPKKPTQPEGWRKWLPLGVAGGVVLTVIGVVIGTNTSSHGPEPGPSLSAAAPSSPATQTPSGGTPGGETGEDSQGGNDGGGNDQEGQETSEYSNATKHMLKIRTADDGRLFVDATQWKPRRTTTYPTYWNLAGEQIRANEGREPTMREYVFVKNALLRVNHETETSARRMPIGHDMFLLSTVQYTAAMEKANG